MSQRYSFIDSGSYVDMAKEYQKYLLANYGQYQRANSDTSAPIVIEVVGAVDKVRQILGIPVSKPLELTTYKEAEDIITQLDSEGMKNMVAELLENGINETEIRRMIVETPKYILNV